MNEYETGDGALDGTPDVVDDGCWFCDEYLGDGKPQPVHLDAPKRGQPIVVRIPRCMRCAAVHRRVSLITQGAYGVFAFAFIGIAVTITMNGTFPAPSNVPGRLWMIAIAIPFAIALIPLFLAGSAFAKRAVTKHGIRRSRHAMAHPAIAELMENGYRLNGTRNWLT